jgi:hypothetical protein
MHPDDPASGAAFTAEDNSNCPGPQEVCAPQAVRAAGSQPVFGPEEGDQAHDYLCAKAPASDRMLSSAS